MNIMSTSTLKNYPGGGSHTLVFAFVCLFDVTNEGGEGRISEIARYQFPAKQIEACTIRKSFLEELNPTEPFHYEELDAPPVVGIIKDDGQPSLFH